MTPARLSDETLRDYEKWFYLQGYPDTVLAVRAMARELLTLRAERDDMWEGYHWRIENVRRVHGHSPECLWTDCGEHLGCQGSLPCTCGTLAKLAALAGRGDSAT